MKNLEKKKMYIEKKQTNKIIRKKYGDFLERYLGHCNCYLCLRLVAIPIQQLFQIRCLKAKGTN